MKNRYRAIADPLFREYPNLRCELNYRNLYELLIASRLSAQCTDVTVNKVCVGLFEEFPTPQEMARASQEAVEEKIRACGLYHRKAQDCIGIAKALTEEHPTDTMEQLLDLPGVGRKIANLVLGEWYHVPGVIVADTHCIRLSNRLGLAKGTDPMKVETALRKLAPPEESLPFCHALVHHGRAVCNAKKPDCAHCALETICPKNGVKER